MPGVGNATPTLLAYARDGFGIYNSVDEHGVELTNNDLDVCHGRTSPVPWNGSTQSVYHYVATDAYPYAVGCFRGAVDPANYGATPLPLLGQKPMAGMGPG